MINLNEGGLKRPVISLTKYVDLPKSKLWTIQYFTEDSAHHAPLLIAHGGPGACHNYLLSLSQLAQYRPVIFYDQGGCGTSTLKAPAKWTRNFFMEELEQLVEALYLKKFHFFGHAWGGALGIDYALEHENRLKSLVLASPLISGKLWSQDAHHLLAQMPIELQTPLRHHEKENTLDNPDYINAKKIYDETHVCRTKPIPEDLQYSLDHVNRDIYLNMFGPYIFKISGTLGSYDRFEDLKDITVPTLITCGRHDISIPETMRKCADQLPHGQLQVFENSAHFPHLEEETPYITALEKFLRTHETTSA